MKAVVAFVSFLLVGNLTILGATAWAKHTARASSPEVVAGVENFRVVGEGLWRGGAPTAEGYRALASRGVRTIVDLRAEETHVPHALVRSLGFSLVHIPVRDGQPPSPAQVERFADVMSRPAGLVFVHCQAGVGRTGSMVAAYLVGTGRADATSAIRRTLAVGPPSLEQLAFIRALGGGSVRRAPMALTVLSRVLDAPRRIWSYVG